MPRRAVRFGKRPPRYSFFLNPYQEIRCTVCPKCRGKTKLRKVPLVIHVEPAHFVILRKTCRFCSYCELLIAHQDELEAQLVQYFSQVAPDAIGNEYLVIGTTDEKDWRAGMRSGGTVEERRAVMHDFKKYLQFELTGGWGPA